MSKYVFFCVTFLVTFCWYHNDIIVLLLKCNYLNSTRVWHYMCIYKIILELIRILKYLSYGNHYTDMFWFSRCIIQRLCMLLYKISALHRHSNADIRRRIACLNWATWVDLNNSRSVPDTADGKCVHTASFIPTQRLRAFTDESLTFGPHNVALSWFSYKCKALKYCC